MKGNVSFRIRKEHKILKAVIISDSIDMMDNFEFFKVATDMFFHYKTMFRNVIIFSSKRMRRAINKNVSVAILYLTSPPTFMFVSLFPRARVWLAKSFSSFIPRSLSYLRNTKTFLRAIFSSFQSGLIYIKSLITDNTFFINIAAFPIYLISLLECHIKSIATILYIVKRDYILHTKKEILCQQLAKSQFAI